MTTDNDAAKAFNGCRTNTVLNGNMVVYYIPLQQEEKIRAALTRSAKVDELLEALKDAIWLANDAIKLPDMAKAAKEYRYRPHIEMYEKAIQRFNGDV